MQQMEKLILEIDNSRKENDRLQNIIMEMDKNYKKMESDIVHVQE
jgi:hypothetical protein